LDEAALDTAGDVAARLAVVPQVLEARGLDVTPQTVARLTAAGDHRSATILTRIYHDEIRHVGVGNYWFRWLCSVAGIDSATAFRRLVADHFNGALKP